MGSGRGDIRDGAESDRLLDELIGTAQGRAPVAGLGPQVPLSERPPIAGAAESIELLAQQQPRCRLSEPQRVSSKLTAPNTERTVQLEILAGGRRVNPSQLRCVWVPETLSWLVRRHVCIR